VRFRDTAELRGAEFVNVDLSGSRFRNVDLTNAKIMEAMLVNARISGLIEGLVLNDVEVAPLIEAEMVRRYPERAKLRPVDAVGAREAWAVIEELWATTKERVAGLPESTLRRRVDDEWSFLETVRHLIFVTDGWIADRVLGRSDYHPIGQPPSFVTDTGSFGIDVDADPTLAEVMAVREDRMATVRALVDRLTDDELDQPRGDETVRSCLWTAFDEEWHHIWFANRDLDVVITSA
jgi:hypothetical protein